MNWTYDPECWSISGDTVEFLEEFLGNHPLEVVLETGSGLSTLLFARSGARVVALEHKARWAEVTRTHLFKHGLTAQVVEAPLVGTPPTYSTAGLDPSLRFDLLFIDGPPGTIGRGGVLPSLSPFLSRGAWVFLDDVRRPEEAAIWDRWCGEFALVDPRIIETDRGLAVGRLESGS